MMVTRCQHCQTRFRITPEQLYARNGHVRCGHCNTVFDALSALTEVANAEAGQVASQSSPSKERRPGAPSPKPAAPQSSAQPTEKTGAGKVFRPTGAPEMPAARKPPPATAPAMAQEDDDFSDIMPRRAEIPDDMRFAQGAAGQYSSGLPGPVPGIRPGMAGAQQPPQAMPPGTMPPGMAGSPQQGMPPGMMPPGMAGSPQQGMPPGMMPPGMAGAPGQPGMPPGMMPPGMAGAQPPPSEIPAGAAPEAKKKGFLEKLSDQLTGINKPELSEEDQMAAAMQAGLPPGMSISMGPAEEAPKSKSPISLFALIMLVVLIVQIAHFYRADIAARYPETKPALLQLCQWLECEIGLPQNGDYVTIESSEMAFDETRDLYNLTLQVLNKAEFSQAYPMLELAFTNEYDKVVTRKNIKPQDYLQDDAVLQKQGIRANENVRIELWIDGADIKNVENYNLYTFYE